MGKSVRISKKWGLNPTMPICFWCRETKNEIALLGKLPGDVEAPHMMWIPGDYEPCDSCKELFDKGIRVVEASTNPVLNENQPPYYGVYPTGRFMVFKEEAFKKIFNENIHKQALNSKMCFVDKDTMNQMVEDFKNKE